LKVGEAAYLVIEHMLGDGMSVIDPTERIWDFATAEALRSAVEDRPIVGDEPAWRKLARQLGEQPRQVMLMAAELVFLRDLPNIGYKADTKVADVARVLSWLPLSVEVPDSMVRALTEWQGSFFGGQGYNQYLWKQLPWLARFVKRWVTVSDLVKDRALSDPWVFHEVVMDDPDDVPSIRNAFLFLVFPRVFEPISSERHKRQLRDAFCGVMDVNSGDDAASVDRDLLAARVALYHKYERPVEWYAEPLLSQWNKPGGEASNALVRPKHYWLYSPGAGSRLWPEFSHDGIMAIGWDEVGDLALYRDRDHLRTALQGSPVMKGRT